MQRAYQLNLVIGNLIAIALAAIAALGLIVTSGVDRPPVRENTHLGRVLIGGDIVRQGGIGNHAEPQGFHGGFITNLRVIPDELAAVVPVAFPISDITLENLEPMMVDSAPGVGDGTGGGIGSGDSDFGLPALSPLPSGASPKPTFTLPERQETIRRVPADRKLYINGFKDPRLPRKATNMKGLATVEITVKASGAVGSVRVIEEEPQGFGFGEALMSALNECVYYPAIVNGKKTEMTVSVTYVFNSGGARAVKTSKNVILNLR